MISKPASLCLCPPRIPTCGPLWVYKGVSAHVRAPLSTTAESRPEKSGAGGRLASSANHIEPRVAFRPHLAVCVCASHGMAYFRSATLLSSTRKGHNAGMDGGFTHIQRHGGACSELFLPRRALTKLSSKYTQISLSWKMLCCGSSLPKHRLHVLCKGSSHRRAVHPLRARPNRRLSGLVFDQWIARNACLHDASHQCRACATQRFGSFSATLATWPAHVHQYAATATSQRGTFAICTRWSARRGGRRKN